jgi:riboflavin synthase
VVSELNTHDATGGTALTIALPPGSTLLADAGLGDSIAINGVCLTLTSFTPARTHFTVGVAPETLRVTDLGALRATSRVNLERAVRADTRMGGHFVQGHVDGVARIAARTPDGNALTLRFRPDTGDRRKDGALLRYLVYKGYVALDGTSLTITRVDDDEGWWEVMLIAYTQERVVLADKKVGETVNVEVDVLAKYAEKSMVGYLGSAADEGVAADDSVPPLLEKIVERVVARHLAGRKT